MKQLPLLLFLLCSTIFLPAQKPLNLEDAIREMKDNNTKIKIQDQEIALSRSALKGSQSAFLPSISASYTGMLTNDPMNAFGFKLQHQNIDQSDFNPESLNHPGANGNFNTQFSIQQPILNFDALAARKALKSRLQATNYQYDFVIRNLEEAIRKSYANLQFLYKAREAVEKGIAAYQEILRNTENMKEMGYVKASDVLLVQVGLNETENKELEIENNMADLSDYLSWLMGREEHVVYQPATSLKQDIRFQKDLNFSKNGEDVLAMESEISARKEMVKVSQNSLLPRLNGFGNYNLNDKMPFGFGAGAYLVGFSLSWDLFKGNQLRNQIQQKKLELGKAQQEYRLYTEQQDLKVTQIRRQLQLNQQTINLTQTAKQQINEALAILKNRYAEGLEKTSDILAAQAKKMEKEVDYFKAIKDYNISAIEFRYLTQQTDF